MTLALQVSSQHPYAETFIGKPHVWTVDVTNKTDVREAVRAILRTEVPYINVDTHAHTPCDPINLSYSGFE